MTKHLEAIEIETGKNPTASVIWMHGLGADGNDFAPIVPELVRPTWPGIRFVFPHAPVQPVTINGGTDIDLRAPTGTSDPYKGVLFYQDPRAPSNGVNKLNGGSDMVLKGAVYFPNQQIQFNGDNNSSSNNCTQIIGRTIESADVRQRFKSANPRAQVARLVGAQQELGDALRDPAADWIYIRFLPTAADVERIHAAGKRVILVGPLVAGHEPAHWQAGDESGVDAILTDYPLELRRQIRGFAAPASQ